MQSDFCRGLLTLLGVLCAGDTVLAQSDVAFPREVYAARRERLARQIGQGVAIVPGRYLIDQTEHTRQDPNFWYLTGVESPYAILVIAPAQKRTALFLPKPYQFAAAQYPMVEEGFRRAIWNRPIGRLVPGREASDATGISETYPVDELDRRLIGLVGPAGTVFLPEDREPMYAPPGLTPPVPLSQQIVRAIADRLPGRTIQDLSPLVSRLRLVKDVYEIAALRRAAGISGEGMVAAMKAIVPGMNDREVAGLMEHAWKRAGSPRASFAPIVASGTASLTFYPLMGEHYSSPDRVMRAGELLFVDYGAAEFQTYTADLCRTLPISGRFTPDQRTYYDILLEAQEAAIAAVKPGVMMLDAIKAAALVFRRHDLERYEDVRTMGEDRVWGLMPSPTHYLTRNAGLVRYSPLGLGVRDLGHHIGLEVQDSRDYSRPLEPGMVVTIEPKLYIPDKQIAIMIEDMILVTADGHENLSAATPKKADEIERVMAERSR